MIHKMYSIYDTAAKAYLPPFILPEDAMAVRAFKDCCNSKDHQFNKNPADFTLMRIACFNDGDASLTVEETVVNLGNGLHLIDNGAVAAVDDPVVDSGPEFNQAEG